MIQLHPAACGIWVLGLLGFLDIAGILMSPLQWPPVATLHNSAHMRSQMNPNGHVWPRGRYLVNAYQTGFGLVVCVLEAQHRVKGVGCTATRFRRHVRLHQSGLEATPDWRRHDARCTMYDGCIDLSPLCSANCSAHCSIAYSEHIAYSCIFKVSIWFNHFSHFSRCNFCNFVSFCHSIQAQRFIHEFAKFLTTFGGSGGLEGPWHERPIRLHGRRHMDANLQ